jgi:hypothetical protein
MCTKAELDVWPRVLEWLMRFSSPNENAVSGPQANASDKKRRACGDRPYPSNRGARVSILERPAPGTATISWYDPAVCHYGEQTWRATVAKQAGVCAVSGISIRRGDSIYRPGLTRPSPLNAQAMILAPYIESVTGRALLATCRFDSTI